jgi:hypothetical protein
MCLPRVFLLGVLFVCGVVAGSIIFNKTGYTINPKGDSVPTLTIDQTTRGSDILSFMGAERLFAVKQGHTALLTPAIGGAEPDEYDIDPDDYPDTTAYLNAIPGCAERLIASMNAPMSEFEDVPRPRRSKRNV